MLLLLRQEAFELLWATPAKAGDILAQHLAQLTVKQMVELLCREELEPRTRSALQAAKGEAEAMGSWASTIHLEKRGQEPQPCSF